MRNRNSIIKNLELIESKLINLKRIVNRQEPIETYLSEIEKAYEALNIVKDFIEDEDLSANELNHI